MTFPPNNRLKNDDIVLVFARIVKAGALLHEYIQMRDVPGASCNEREKEALT